MGAEQENAEYLRTNCTFCWVICVKIPPHTLKSYLSLAEASVAVSTMARNNPENSRA